MTKVPPQINSVYVKDISEGLERVAMISEKTIKKKYRLLVKVSMVLGSSKQIKEISFMYFCYYRANESNCFLLLTHPRVIIRDGGK